MLTELRLITSGEVLMFMVILLAGQPTFPVALAVQITGSSIPEASSNARETLNGRQCS
jgi:hypothetical protein